jgi:hypothetical protein
LIYPRMKELWIPKSDAIRDFKVTMEQINQAVLGGKIRTLKEFNVHSQEYFTIYAVADIEKLFKRKRQAKNFTKKEMPLWEH